MSLKQDDYDRVVNYVKLQAGIDQNKKHTPGDGKFALDLDGSRVVCRLSTLPTIYKDSIVLRLLKNDPSMLDIGKLGFSKPQMSTINEMSALREGLVIIAGPTGSGKTTTLYSLLGQYDPKMHAIFTLEDPVEYQVPFYRQAEVNNGGEGEIGMSFARGLKGLLRQDPDILLVGEMRDPETAKICMEASNTGHLVMGTLHANSAVSVIPRLKQLGIEIYMIEAGLKYVVFQKMFKKLCPHCVQKKPIDEAISGRVVSKLGLGGSFIYGSNLVGCTECVKGYNGSTIASEIIKVDSRLCAMISRGESENIIKETLGDAGWINVYEDALIKCTEGLIDFRSIMNYF